jgi:hypothetical protein
MKKLMGKSHYKNYDTHYAPVKPANPSDPKNAVFLHLMIEDFGKQIDEIKFN